MKIGIEKQNLAGLQPPGRNIYSIFLRYQISEVRKKEFDNLSKSRRHFASVVK